MFTTLSAALPYDWSDVPFFMALPLLLIASAFFSGCETALFSLTTHQRTRLARSNSVNGRMVGQLLADPQMLLITLLLGNATVNVLYFVISSVLLLQLDPEKHGLYIAAGTLGPLLLVIGFGEMLPKLVANQSPLRWVKLTTLPLYALHRVIGPLRILFGQFIIAPLGRLVSPAGAPPALSADELEALVEVSQHRGVINRTEEQTLREVVQLGHQKIRDIMIPRVDVVGIGMDATSEEIRRIIDQKRLTRIPVYRLDLDHIQGLLYSRQFLLAQRTGNQDWHKLIRRVHFVPELQRVDQLLAEFRRTGLHLAMVVDEYGGTAGLVTLKDVVERLLGEVDINADSAAETESQLLAPGRWRVSGALAVHDWAEMFNIPHVGSRIATVGGLVTSMLGRIPKPGDQVHLRNLLLTIETVERARVRSVLLELRPPTPPNAPETGGHA
ncbi:MAG: hemolysin family protein [Phycisphaerales bacterium]